MNDSTANANAPPSTAPEWGVDLSARGLIHRLYSSNPFYVISAALVFVGLRMSFDTHGKTFETGALMLALAGYTLLLATTAAVLVRLGDVWDDIRTLLLLVVMMFLALSISLDDTLTSNPRHGAVGFIGGLVFAVAVSEGLLRGLRLGLPAGFRVSYYAILGLFFLYPLALVPFLNDPDGPALQWVMFGFSPASGVVALSLLPAIRRGRAYVAKNGSPWTWPLYPWILFEWLGLGVCARSFYLCLSFHFVQRTKHELTNNIFGFYFLVPFLYAVGLLLLELGLVARSRAALRVALAFPPGLLLLAMVGHRPDAVYQRFLGMFMDGLGGSPLFLTLIAAVIYYAYAAFRHVPLATGALTAALAALAVVGARTLDLDGLVAPRPWPILAAGVLQWGLGLRRWDSGRCLLGAACFVAAATISLAPSWTEFERGVLAFHLALGAVLLIGAVFDDVLGRTLRHLGPVMLTLAALVEIRVGPGSFAGVPSEVVGAYPLLAAASAAAYGVLIGSRFPLAAALVSLTAWASVASARAYVSLRHVITGLDQIAWGMAFFVVAALISVRKTGAWRRWLARREGEGTRSLG